MDNITRFRKLKALRELYAYDIAMAQQGEYTFSTNEEELEVLAMLHLSRQIQAAAQEFVETVDIGDLRVFGLLGVICNECVGKIAGRLEQIYPKEAIDEVLIQVDDARERFREGDIIDE